MGARDITDDLVRQVAADLRDRYGLDDEDVRVIGARLAGPAQQRSEENVAFAERFVAEHRGTFDRLSK